MKISGRKPVNRAGQAGPISHAKDKGQVDKAPAADTAAADVNLSETTREVNRARQTLAQIPDVRVERVNELKPIVEDGSYHVESKVLAKKIVDTSLRESAVLGHSRKKR